MTSNALSQGFIRCHDCGALSSTEDHLTHCPRCLAPLHARLPNSLQRTTAFLLSGWFLYIPANIFPIMTVTSLGVGEPSTIFGGIIELIQCGMLPIGIVVLIASILVPMFKLIGISLLLLAIHFRWNMNPRVSTVMYRVIAAVGPWSMLDIFVISLLVSLVDLGGIAQITAGPAATAFAGVVILTIFAAENFDPRLLWDNHQDL